MPAKYRKFGPVLAASYVLSVKNIEDGDWETYEYGGQTFEGVDAVKVGTAELNSIVLGGLGSNAAEAWTVWFKAIQPHMKEVETIDDHVAAYAEIATGLKAIK